MLKKKMKHTHRHTKMKILAEKIVKKIRSSISRPHRTQFPLVHINIHTHNRHVSPRSHLYDYLTHTHTHTHADTRSATRVWMLPWKPFVLWSKWRREGHTRRNSSSSLLQLRISVAAIDSGWTNTFAPSPPPVVVVLTHTTHMITHIHTQVHSHTPVAHFRSS